MQPSFCSSCPVALLSFVICMKLHVAAQITWRTKPQHTVVTLGKDLVLDCRGNSEAPAGGQLSYSWLFNHSAVQPKALRMANASLFIPELTFDDQGLYTCIIGDVSNGESVNASAQVVIAFIEDFIFQPENVTVSVGSDAILTCVTGRSAPPPIVHWEVNGVNASDANTFSVSFGNFDPTGLSGQISMKLNYTVLEMDVQRVRCVAMNPLLKKVVASSVASVFPLLTNVAPQILSHFPEAVLAREFQQLFLDCKIVGYPKPYAVWFKDRDYVDETRATTLKNGTLFFSSLSAEDAGNYTCEARSSVGRALSNKTRIVVAAIGLQFIREPMDTTALAGTSTTLHCISPSSIPPTSVTWYKDYSPFLPRSGTFAAIFQGGIAQSQNSTVVQDNAQSQNSTDITYVQASTEWNLVFTSVQKSDEGVYYCVATNPFSVPSSRTSQTAQLTVYSSPLISQPPVNTRIIKGTLLHLSCLVELSTVQSVYWMFNGERVLSSSVVSITNNGQHLWINDVSKSWEGWYTCTAENSFGRKTASALVSVVVPPVTLQELGPRSMTAGYAVLLSCYIYGDPQPVFVWYHDGRLVVEDSRHKLLPTGLYINPVAVGDRGNYSCFGNNSAGTAVSSGFLEVYVPPTVNVGKAEVIAIIGEPLTLKCQVEGYPLPTRYWLHNGTAQLVRQSLLTADNSTLTLTAYEWNMSGNYTCVATNVAAAVAGSVILLTQAKPKVEPIAGSSVIHTGQVLNLTCLATGVPIPHLTWQLNAQPLLATLDGRVGLPSPGTLLVKFVSKSDEGQYTCLAVNAVGKSNSSIDVIIVEPPKPPSLLEAVAVSVNSVLLKWQHVFQPPDTDVVAFVIYYRKRVGGKQTMYPSKLSALTLEKEVEGLEAGTEYVFTVSAENTAGEGVASNSLSATTFSAGPSEPTNLCIFSVSATTATVAWERPSQSSGVVQCYQLQYKKSLDSEFLSLNVTSTASPTLSITLQPLLPYTSYTMRVRAAISWQGSALWGPFSSTISLRTNMSAPSLPPSDFRASSVDSFSVLVTWGTVPVDYQNGPITGYRLTYSLLDDKSSTLNSQILGLQMSTVVFGLSPWTWYSFTLEAKNPMGYGPKTNAFTIRTNPVAPTAPPEGCAVSAVPGNTILVTWQEVPEKSRNSVVSNYIVQCRKAGETDVRGFYVGANHTLFSISGLLPWTWYEVRVAAQTNQVVPGIGPFSAWTQVRTLQSAAGLVRGLSFTVTSTAISLSWRSPALLNGELSGYRVDYHPLPLKEQERKVKIVTADITQTELESLQPGVSYNLSVLALNGAGAGQPTILHVTTAQLAAESPSSKSTALQADEEDQTISLAVEASAALNKTEGASSKDLPGIIAGSLIGAVILIVLVVVLICHCIRARQETRAKYFVNNDGFERFGSTASVYRPTDDTSNIIPAPSLPSSPVQPLSAPSFTSPQQQQSESAQHNGGKQFEQLGDQIWLRSQAQKAEGPAVYLPVTERPISVTSFSSLSLSPLLPGEQGVFALQGLDNYGFIEEKLSLPGLPANHEPQPECASPVTESEQGSDTNMSTLNRRHKEGRMRCDSAAAIAVMQHISGTRLSSADDEQLLINDENIPEVVFNERITL